MTKYRKKPEIVEAEQFFIDKKPWPEGVYDRRGGSLVGSTHPYWLKMVFGGETSLSDGDWIITYDHGGKTSMRPDNFAKTYEKV